MTSPAELEDFKRAVEAACETFAANFARGDLDALVRDYYTEDASMIAPDAPRQQGRGALKAVLAAIKDSGVARVILTPVDLVCDGGIGYEIGNASLFAAGAPESSPMRYVVVWRKTGGGWKAAVDMFSAGTV